ncbi:hypothetical protein LTR56_023637 [Elasticomyces elasticus]|nr:hypothetical protein LTR56_023637 [Elasticomyces elasticus]KAK3623788.1 hypothetical protein LTR22_024242 [Elasticomyces elasticus]KAK5766198.1 hypothetical protein LTS12_003682 [Elasticomyces elasticus]
MAALWETIAYAFRALGSKNQQSSGIATVAQILVLVAPIWVNAFAYMVFARIVHFYSPTRKVWFFSPSILALIFVTLDIASFVIQLIGGGMAGPGASADSQQKGLNIYMGGIGMQEGFIVLFLGLVIKFHRDQLRTERIGRLSADKITGWRWLIWALYGCLATITIRIIYRLAEFSAGLGTSNPLPSNEALLYVLESTPMWLAILVWNIVHPGRFVRDDSDLADNQEMHPVPKNLRSLVAAAPVDPFLDAPSRSSSPNGSSREQLRLRPSSASENYCVVSSAPLSYTAYRPREFSS